MTRWDTEDGEVINNQSTRTEVPRPALRGEGEVKTRQGGAQGKGGRRSQFNPLFLLTFWFLPLVCQVRTKRGYHDFFLIFWNFFKILIFLNKLWNVFLFKFWFSLKFWFFLIFKFFTILNFLKFWIFWFFLCLDFS